MEQKDAGVLTIPNLISFFRIALIPFIMWTYFIDKPIVCAILIIISFLSDVADGIIARKFNLISALGKALDPVADKLTLLAILICLSIEKPILYALVGIFIIKEVTVGVEGLILLKLTGTTYSAKWYGKVTTGVLYASALIFVIFQSVPFLLTQIIFYTCISANILSLVLYSIMNVRRINSLKKERQKELISI